MKLNVENLGYIDKGSVELGELTVICGPNNVGKTYLSSTLYSFLCNIKSLSYIDLPDDFKESFLRDKEYTLDLATLDISKVISNFSKVFNNSLSNIFASDPSLFYKTNISIDIDKDSFNDCISLSDTIPFPSEAKVYLNKESGSSKLTISLFTTKDFDLEYSFTNIVKLFMSKILYLLTTPLFPTPFQISSERTGIAVFQREIDNKKIALLDTISALRDNEKISNIFSKVEITYSKPIGDNLEILRNYESISKGRSFIAINPKLNHIIDSMYDLIGGECKYINHEIVFIPKPEPGREQVLIPLNLASSSVKSLVLLELYIKSLATENDLVLIDEPELNLHPSNQRKMAGLLAQLVNAGVKVLITTHSDFIVRELNNRIMLSGDVEDKSSILNNAHISESELLKPDQIKAYSIREDHLIHSLAIDLYGIDLEDFDQVIIESNSLSNYIYNHIKD